MPHVTSTDLGKPKCVIRILFGLESKVCFEAHPESRGQCLALTLALTLILTIILTLILNLTLAPSLLSIPPHARPSALSATFACLLPSSCLPSSYLLLSFALSRIVALTRP